jgi:peptide-methionine (R)-S-oxide reductase
MDNETKTKRLQELTDEEKLVTQEKGTERPFQNKYWDNHEDGTYTCKVCGAVLFSSKNKFESGSGWPSYDQPVTPGVIKYVEDNSHGMSRIEAVCGNCGAHLGHIFPDGPKETTGKRYCINSASLDFHENRKDE